MAQLPENQSDSFFVLVTHARTDTILGTMFSPSKDMVGQLFRVKRAALFHRGVLDGVRIISGKRKGLHISLGYCQVITKKQFKNPAFRKWMKAFYGGNSDG